MTPNERAKFRALKAELEGERQLADHLAEALTYGGIGNAMQALLHHEIARNGIAHRARPIRYRKATRDVGNGQHVEWKGFDCSPFQRFQPNELTGDGGSFWYQGPTIQPPIPQDPPQEDNE
jgi:hypothetical protein